MENKWLTILTPEGISLTLMPLLWHASCQAVFANFVSTATLSGNGAWVTIKHWKIEVAITRISLEISSKSLAFMHWCEPSIFFLIFGSTIALFEVTSSGRLVPRATGKLLAIVLRWCHYCPLHQCGQPELQVETWSHSLLTHPSHHMDSELELLDSSRGGSVLV